MLSPMMQCAGRIRVKDCPFGSPDGTSNQFQLVDRHGHAVAQDVRIESIYQTDWQGRVELSGEARTNLARWTEIGAHYYTGPGAAHVGTTPTPAGDDVDVFKTLADGNPYAQVSGPRQGLTKGKAYSCWFIAKAIDAPLNAQVRLQRTGYTHPVQPVYDLATGVCDTKGLDAGMHSIGDGWYLCWARDLVPETVDTSLSTIYMTNYAGSATDPDQTFAIGLLQFFDDNRIGAYIPTTDTPVTVTDYTASADGQITLGQVPQGESSPGAGDAAVLDWTGSARRAA